MISNLTQQWFPLSNPVHIFALVSLIILLVPIILVKLRLPGTVGLILAGAFVGPHGLNIIDKDDSIILFGTVGIIYIMFLSGLDVDFMDFKRSSKRSLIFGLLTFAIPQFFGTIVGYYGMGLSLKASILLASMFASHTLLAYPIASRLGITRDEAVVVAIGGTLVTNTISLSILAIITSSMNGTLGFSYWGILVASFLLFFLLMFVVLPLFSRWFFRNIDSEGISQFMFILAAVFISASIAHLLGIEPVIGAFLAGLALSRMVPSGSSLLNRINFVGNSLFIPYFLIYVGMLVNFRVFLGGIQALTVAAVMTGTATLAKWGAAKISQKVFRYSNDQGSLIFGLSNAQAANTLAAVMVGYRLGILDSNVLNGTIVMIFVTCVTSAIVVERAGSRLATELAANPELEGDNIQRILVPISKKESVSHLLDFAFAIKDPKASDPVYPLTVVTDTIDTKNSVTQAHSLLNDARYHASSSESSLKPVSRIDVSALGGIIRAIREMEISCVVLGWSEGSSTKEYVFGSLYKHLLEHSHQMVFINGMRDPLNTIKRLVVVLAPHSEFEHGFKNCLSAISNLRQRLRVPMVFQGVENTLNAVRNIDDPVVFAEQRMIAYDSWRAMSSVCHREMAPYDLTVFLTARDGCISWNADIEPFAKKTKRRFPESNLVLLYSPAKPSMVDWGEATLKI
jgi:Kef-type K+ transport system membrane component KefB